VLGAHGPRIGSLFLFLIAFVAADRPVVGAEPENSPPADRSLVFDIPAQPLDHALEAYEQATGTVGVYNGTLAVGRVSHALKGRLAPEIALLLLLKDSGLKAERLADDTFVVIPDAGQTAAMKTPSAIAAVALANQDTAEQRYSALVQAGIGQSLCARPETRPGTYRLVLRFWIGSSGEVARLKLLGSTGDPGRDAAISATVGRLSVGEPPPAAMAQPFTMVILPRSANASIDCPSVESDDRHG
jgi:hypothetical protein